MQRGILEFNQPIWDMLYLVFALRLTELPQIPRNPITMEYWRCYMQMWQWELGDTYGVYLLCVLDFTNKTYIRR